MTRRQKVIIGILIALVLLLLALALYFLLMRPKTAVPTVDVTAQGSGAPTAGLPDAVSPNRGSTAVPKEGEQPAEAVPAEPPDETSSLKRFAMAFAERFGSFSNQTDFVNITDLKSAMTASMAAWADGYLADARAAGTDTTVYSGTTTRALKADIEAFDENAGTATVRVGTQRRQDASGTAAGEVYYQDIVIELIKVNGEWKADSAEWQPRQ